jgi:nucleotide-binding universal stress UspA family protein
VHETSYAGPESVILVPMGGAAAPSWQDTVENVTREIEAFLGPTRDRVAAIHVKPGNPGDVIPDVAKEGRFDLIIMGTNGRSGLSRLLVGSVAESVMRAAQVPVLTLRMPRREPRERIPL